MVSRYIYTVSVCAVALLTAAPALARTPLYYAHITSVRNRVRMLPRYYKARPAKVSDLLMWGDGLATSRSSRADLRFNDGSRVRFGQHVVFRFEPGTRRMNLANGTVLLLIPPRKGQTRVYTPNAVAGIQGSALFMRYDAGKNQTIVGALTDSGIQVSLPDGSQTQTLAAGQIVVVKGNQVQSPAEFDLRTFYKVSPIVQGFQLDQPQAQGPDQAIMQVREETLAGIAAQRSFRPDEPVAMLDPSFVRLSTLNNTTAFEKQQQVLNNQAVQTPPPSLDLPAVVPGADTANAEITFPAAAPQGQETLNQQNVEITRPLATSDVPPVKLSETVTETRVNRVEQSTAPLPTQQMRLQETNISITESFTNIPSNNRPTTTLESITGTVPQREIGGPSFSAGPLPMNQTSLQEAGVAVTERQINGFDGVTSDLNADVNIRSNNGNRGINRNANANPPVGTISPNPVTPPQNPAAQPAGAATVVPKTIPLNEFLGLPDSPAPSTPASGPQ